MLAASLAMIAVSLHTISFIVFSATLSGFSGLYAGLGWLLAGFINVIIYFLTFVFLFLPGYILLLPAYHLTMPAGSKIVGVLMSYDWLLHIFAVYQILVYRGINLTSIGGILFLLLLSLLPMVLAAKTFRGQRSTIWRRFR